MTKWVLMAVTMAAVTGCGPRGERMEKMVQWKVDDALDELDATPAQRTRVQELTKTLVAEAKPVMAKGLETRAALVDQWKAPTPDSARVHQLVDAQLDAFRGLAHRLVDGVLEVHALLTPTQRDEVTQRLQRLEKHGKR